MFDRAAITRFRFVRREFDPGTGRAQLVYAFDDGPELIEAITIPGAPFPLNPARAAALAQALKLLHLIAGVSYYKAAVPPEIVVEGEALDAATASLMEAIYVHGLGEFAYRNGLDLRARIRFPHSDTRAPAAQALGLDDHALTAIGGGKDSLVSIAALREAGVEQTLLWVGNSPLIAACAAHTGLPTLNLKRQLTPELFDYNRQGAWNGHIPVTAINSAIAVMAAIVHGANQIVFSNERSANVGSHIVGAGEVNHQWSKGWAFEHAFADYVRAQVAADLQYYSLLRPLSELAIARQFARTGQFDAHFSSCNRNFHLLGERPAQRWCGVCPKCHFVFLALAPFMPKPRLLNIFGRNLLDEAELIPGFDALIEYQDHKPFECVGEGRESRAALAALAVRPEWQEDAIVQRFARDIRPQLDAAELELAPLLSVAGEHGIPPTVWERVRERFGA